MNRRLEEWGEGSVLYRLSGDPGASFGERARHHGARLLLLFALAAMVTVFFPPTEGMDVTPYSVGMVAPEDVIAQIPFSVPKTATDLERERRLAAEAVPRTFDERSAAGDSVAARLGRFFGALDSAAAVGDTLALGRILQMSRVSATPSQMRYIVNDRQRTALRTAGQAAAREIIPRGMADPAEISAVTTDVIYVRVGPERTEQTRAVSEVITSREFFARAVLFLPPDFPPDAQDLLRLVLIFHLEYSLIPNVIETETDREAARSSVPLTKADVLQGEAIVRAADPIGQETFERLDAYANELRAAGLLESEDPVAGALFGAGLLTFILLSIFGLLLYFSRPLVYANFRWLLLLALLTAAYFGAALGIHRGGLPAEWLPIAFVALPVAVLWDTRISLLLVLLLAAITGTLAPFSSYGTVLVVMGGGAAAAMSVRAVRRRSETWVSIAIIAGAAALVSLAYGLSTSQPLGDVARAGMAITGNATVSALLAVGFLWVFELFTGITTDQTLLEWADPTRPLLRRLSMEAPGTYAHTINVANLAEAAATEIGASGLLCRVGVLYHDVGKMLKPHYFVENQPDSRNPHDKLKPETSASIVREHVTEGVRLAREAKVPGVVVQFILEHHGTQRIGFFYEKAREAAGGEVDPTRFSYPGPKPRSRETAIVMLADSCESATRAMRDPTPERIRHLIDTVVKSKVSDGQLDEAPLTLGEIAKVKDQFVKILGGVVHRRIEYPETKHLTEAEGDGPEPSVVLENDGA
ncbi:MAG: HDIG domain-containing protein [Gemmatimonadetes bacterium]|nr:HDIG domain-containing protein [Gemmatimonadota bacterium]MDA1102869.1 HDIG domain-containing protein [Gemmatimonadota bacterium]